MDTKYRAIVVGATSGIGRELAQILAQNGCLVGITGRRTEKLIELCTEYPDVFSMKAFDITDTDNVAQNLNALVEVLGGLDLVVINSGTGYRNADLDFEKERVAIDVNVLGFTCIADWAFRLFEKQGRGHIVAVSSVAGIRGNRWAPAYGATKAYIINYLEALRAKTQKERSKICITDIRPGFVNTELINGKGLFWVANVDKAAQQIYRAIRRKRKVVYITKRWRVVGAGMKLLPKWLYCRV
jgi:short-subunit dehydrogenase